MKDYKLDGDDYSGGLKVTESKGGTIRVGGKTKIQRLRDFKKRYGEDAYLTMLKETGIENPKCIKIAAK